MATAAASVLTVFRIPHLLRSEAWMEWTFGVFPSTDSFCRFRGVDTPGRG
jgi:hypothetical protein